MIHDIKNFLVFGDRYPRPFILDFEDPVASLGKEAKVNGTPWRGELHRIGQEIVANRAEPVPVSPHVHGVHPQVEAQRLAAQTGLVALQQFCDDGGQRDGLGHSRACLALGQAEFE